MKKSFPYTQRSTTPSSLHLGLYFGHCLQNRLKWTTKMRLFQWYGAYFERETCLLLPVDCCNMKFLRHGLKVSLSMVGYKGPRYPPAATVTSRKAKSKKATWNERLLDREAVVIGLLAQHEKMRAIPKQPNLEYDELRQKHWEELTYSTHKR